MLVCTVSFNRKLPAVKVRALEVPPAPIALNFRFSKVPAPVKAFGPEPETTSFPAIGELANTLNPFAVLKVPVVSKAGL